MDSNKGGPSEDPVANPGSRRPSVAEEPESSQAPKKPVVKKRTKTGCYTCRRRRIKCDEGKPRCNNCIKSKRQCDGYNQRVIFKDPMGTFQSTHVGPAGFQTNPVQPMLVNAQIPAEAPTARSSSQGSLPFIAPRPSTMHDMTPTAPHPLHQGLEHPAQHQLQPQMQMQQNLLHHEPYMQPWQQRLPPSPPPPPPPPPPPLAGQAGNYAEAAFFRAPHYEHFTVPVAAVDTSANTTEWIPAGNVANNGMSPAMPPAIPLYQQNIGEASRQLEPVELVTEEDMYWNSDDEASMVESEDDDDDDGAEHLQSNDLGAIVARRLRPFDRFGTQMRSFSNFVDANVLSTYVPSSLNSPLNDAQTAAIFWYFINVTGPSMSLFERHPIDPSPIFQGQPVPKARQHIWTYTFPIIALNHPALLQAMLALGSLQMAKLQGEPATASMKHYHLSLRRIARNYQSVSRRVQPATLAATMLLGFYEVWNSDHDKWCKHMWGARAILKEIPLRDMTHKIRILKREQRQRLQSGLLENATAPFSNIIVADRDIDQVDSDLVAALSGQPVGYETENDAPSSFLPTFSIPDHYTEKDIETFENINDIFWWYCKMDVYQSILGATPLLMDYGYWTQSAPRAPIGKIDAVYGTYDHLILLLGRLCNFVYRDQSRKRKAKRPDGPGNGPGQSPPPFAGMMPATGHITIPKGFSPPRESSPQSDSQDEIDFETRTSAAMQEWEAIKHTMEVFRSHLGPDFDPLGPEYEPPVSSPFGLALKYRTYGVAGIWMNYYMGLIALYRCHPSMPPIAMAAASMAARQTAPYAIEIGRIVAGLTVDDFSKLTHVSTLLGAISIESSFPLFVAAVQYQDLAQRHWTIIHMHNVARLTGWQSARQIAIGCERGWLKAASVGRGPPYEPPPDLVEVPQSIWSRPRRIIDRIREMADDDEKIVLSSSERPQYAIGLLSVETDLENLDLDKE